MSTCRIMKRMMALRKAKQEDSSCFVRSLAFLLLKLALARAMTTSVICSCFCFVVLVSIVVASRTVLMRTVVAVRCKRERKKNVVDVRSFVLTAIHTCMHTSFSATNTATSFICYREKKKKRMKAGRRKRMREKKDAEEKKAVFLSFGLSCSSVLFLVPCFVVLLRWVPRPPGASSLLSLSRIIISRQ